LKSNVESLETESLCPPLRQELEVTLNWGPSRRPVEKAQGENQKNQMKQREI
jgi:hypothetical protein